jgi:hypothetical protein
MKKILPFILCNLLALASFAQIGINTDSPSPAAALEIKSSYNNKNHGGLLIPTVDATERDNISSKANTADEGMLIYFVEGNTRCLQIYDGLNGSWVDVYCMPTNYAPTASNVFISGIIEETKTLTANYTYSDIDGDAEGATTFEWFVADDAQGTNTTALGVNANTYTLQTADVSKFISVRVTPVASTGVPTGSPLDSPLRGPIKAVGGVASDLFISEYIHRSTGDNKILEIANFTGQDVDLSDYEIHIYVNGDQSVSDNIQLSGNLVDGEVLVLANNKTGKPYEPEVDVVNGSIDFNGNDYIGLYKESTTTYIDVLGGSLPPPTSPSNFANDTKLLRLQGFGPNATYTPSEFSSASTSGTPIPSNTYSDIGSHTY